MNEDDVLIKPDSLTSDPDLVHLRLLETTDLHLHIHPYDYYSDRPQDGVGLARTAGLIEALRAEAPNSLLFDNGDFLQGNPMGDYVARERGVSAERVHPIIAAMNAVRYDAGTVGNHEFNYGLTFLHDTLAGANFPLTCANVLTRRGDTPCEDETLLPPYLILDRQVHDGAGRVHALRIGVIGFTPPQITIWDQSHLMGRVSTRDIVGTARARVAELRAAGADIIVALCHSGITVSRPTEGMENAALPLARVPGIDAVMTGHSHLVFPSASFAGLEDVDVERGTLAGKPAVMAGFWGSHVGVIDLALRRDADGWSVADFAVAARPIQQRGKDGCSMPAAAGFRAVLEATTDDHVETLRYIRRPVGETRVALHSYFAPLMPTPALELVCIAQRDFVKAALAGGPLGDLPLLSAAAPFKAGGRGGPGYYTDIAPGPLALRNLGDLYLFPNTLRAVRISGANLRNWLERAVGVFHHIPHGTQDAALIQPDFPCYNFDTISGLTYEIDLAQPPAFRPDASRDPASAGRIRNLCHDGRPVDPAQDFIVATNDYRAAGGGDVLTGASVVLQCPQPIREVLLDHIRQAGPVAPQAPKTWRFCDMPGTTALFLTSPRAACHLADLPMPAEMAGIGRDGFARLRIHL